MTFPFALPSWSLNLPNVIYIYICRMAIVILMQFPSNGTVDLGKAFLFLDSRSPFGQELDSEDNFPRVSRVGTFLPKDKVLFVCLYFCFCFVCLFFP